MRPIPDEVVRAIHHMRKHRQSKVTGADLAVVAGVASRTLAKRFQRFVGISPLSYLRRLRLVAVRETLLSSSCARSVTEVAAENGFTHFGRFSAQYGRQFGEAPSATLRRSRAVARQRPGATGDDAHEGLPTTKLLSREVPSVAILPWRALSAEPAHRWFAEGLASAIAAALSSTRSLSVVLVGQARAAGLTPRRIAREFSAGYMMTGQLTACGQDVRLVVSIAETGTGNHLWGDSYQGDAHALFALQDRLIAGIRRTILPNIRNNEIGKAQRALPRDLDARGLTMRAMPFVFRSRPDAAKRALELLQRAMEIDPDYGLATGLAAWCHGQLVMYNGSATPSDDKSRAIQLAERASLLDEDDPFVMTARCAVQTMIGDFEGADALLARALQLEPGSAWAWGRSGWLNAYLGRHDAAIAHLQHAIQLEPDSWSNGNNLVGIAAAHFGAGRYEAAIASTREALRAQPEMKWANRTLSAAYACRGERSEALRSLETLRRYSPDITVGRVLAAVPFRQHHLDRLGEALRSIGLPT